MNHYPEAFAALGSLALLLAGLVKLIRDNRRARNEEQLADHLRMARGMLALKKQGRVRGAEDLQ